MADVETHRFPCGTCGSDLRYAPGERHLECDHCGATQALGAAPVWDRSATRELDFEAARRGIVPEAQMEETRVVQCSSCGAQVEFNDEEHSAECPFCATPVVTDTGVHRHIKPGAVLPFNLTNNNAQDALKRWIKGLWFAPNALKSYARADQKMQGIYVPHWTFDAQTETAYTGERGTEYTRTVGSGKDRRTVTEVRWRNVSGHVSQFFDDVVTLGSNSVPRKHAEKVGTWDLSALESYRPEFLAGFRAEGYTIDLDAASEDARDKIEAHVRQLIRSDIGGDRQRIHQVNMQLSNITFKHILLPVWIAAYKFRSKSYQFVVNGRTGDVSGERPYSPWKIAIAVVIGAAIAGAIVFVASQS